MDLSKLTYTKGASGRVPNDYVQPTPDNGVSQQNHLDVSKIPSAYLKPEGVLSSNLVFVLSGGEKKEKDFLRELIKQRRLHSLRVVFMSEKGQGLQPYQMNAKWLEIQKNGAFVIEGQTFHLDAMDEVFLLSDVDEFYDQLVQIMKETSAECQGRWIISNPCFEIWLYYCYLNDPEHDLAQLIPLTVSERSQRLKSLGHTLVPGGLNPYLAFERMTVGIENSEKHYCEDENAIPALFATRMYEMAQYLIDTLNEKANEHDEFVKYKEEWRALKRRLT